MAVGVLGLDIFLPRLSMSTTRHVDYLVLGI
jgi:hypothetical protein